MFFFTSGEEVLFLGIRSVTSFKLEICTICSQLLNRVEIFQKSSLLEQEALNRGQCNVFCKHMCGSVINFLYFNSKEWKSLPKKLPLVQ